VRPPAVRLAIAIVVLGVFAGCGGSPDETSETGSVDGAAAALEARFGERDALAAALLSLDRGYSWAQIVIGAEDERLERDGTILLKRGANALETPARAAAGRFTRARSEVALVSLRPVPIVAAGAPARSAEDLDRLMLMLELIASQMKESAPAEERPEEPTTYNGLVVLLEMARTGYSADEIFLALADDEIGAKGRFRRAPDSSGFTIIILNEDGSYQCPEGSSGDYCREVGARRTPSPATETAPRAPAASAEPTAPPAAAGCHRGRIALPPELEAHGYFLGYTTDPAIELCLPQASGGFTGTFELDYRADIEALYRGSALALDGPCKMQIRLTAKLTGSGSWSGTAFSATASLTVTSTETVLEGCADEEADTEVETWGGPLLLSGTAGTLGTGEDNLELHISNLKK
jgi:hypothetical protein